MLKWATSKYPLLKGTQLSFCQRTSFNPQHFVIVFRQNKFFLSRSYFVNKSRCVGPVTVFNKSLMSPNSLLLQNCYDNVGLAVSMSSQSDAKQPVPEEQKLSNKDKLKRAVKDYGATVIVFHIMLSLTSLGISYLTISSGVDVTSLLSKVGLGSSSDLAAGASTFVVAYAVHKMFAPVRISITLGAAPFIVRYLRRVGVLKPPKTKS